MDSTTLLNRLLTKGKFRHLQAIVRLNDLRNISRAAESIGITQPAMSLLVSDLEKLLETRLFLRHTRGVEPTPAAMELITVAGYIIKHLEDGAEAISAQIFGARYFVRVAATASMIENLFVQTIPEFTQKHPEIQVDLNEISNRELDEGFASGEYDLICCLKKEVLPEGWDFCPCVNDKLVAVCSSSSSLGQSQDFNSRDFGQETWLPNHARTASRRGFDYLKKRHSWDNVKTVNLTSRSISLTFAMLHARELVTVLPRSIVKRGLEDGSLVELPLDIGISHWQLGIHWQSNNASPATVILLNALKTHKVI
ncbi:LysR family transcriptional regulator [uncultured Cohaesibacter sp.]|uniref:LysR family transcriptional regulator n=1 Tax=uncultured Cohaesibacter sp. TaxID=1002546 RepID=UPI00292DBA19|nr:LysR family transcriptional regulator [uncultured Cohaesibacter sp.]